MTILPTETASMRTGVFEQEEMPLIVETYSPNDSGNQSDDDLHYFPTGIHQRILISIDQTHNIIIVIRKSISVFVGITVLCDPFQFAKCVFWLFHC